MKTVRRLGTSAIITAMVCALAWLGIMASSRSELDSRDEGTAVFQNSDLLRFHVIANSDTQEDQAVKRMVRDSVLVSTRSLMAEASDAGQARSLAIDNLSRIESIANATLSRAGAVYRAKAVVEDWDFPVRTYGDLVVPAGRYPAVRILLGRAKGENWWCVLFPPLCFADFDSGFAISQTKKVSAIKALETGTAAGTKPKVKFRFALRALEHPAPGRGGQLVMGK